RSFRPLRTERRFHPDLHISWRTASRRAAICGFGKRTWAFLGRADGIWPRLCRDAQSLAKAVREGGFQRRASGIRRSVPRSLALLSDVLRRWVSRRRYRRGSSDDGAKRIGPLLA